MTRLGATTFPSFYPRAIYRVPSRRHHDHHHWKGSIILLYFPPPTTDYPKTILMTGNKVKLRSNLSPSRVTRAGSVPRYAGKKGGLAGWSRLPQSCVTFHDVPVTGHRVLCVIECELINQSEEDQRS